MQLQSSVLISCLGASATVAGYQSRTVTDSPCAQVSSSAAAALAASPSATPVVDGELALACLKSVPLRKIEAMQLMDSIYPYVEWQSDTSYLKNPLPEYLEPAVDIWAELDQVYSQIKGDAYDSEYDFLADLLRVFNSVHDGHFRFIPDLLSKALTFNRNLSLVSVSLDGKQEPQIYIYFNGQEAVQFMENWSQLGNFGDPDTLYNLMFFSKPAAATSRGHGGYFAGSGSFRFIYPGANTTVNFANGTSRSYRTTANVIGDFTGITDGKTMYEKFCTGPSMKSNTTSTTAPQSTQAPGYPEPEVISSDNSISGYFLDSSRNMDVAVLSMLSFHPYDPSEFQWVFQNFLEQAKAVGKSKLVIDLSLNGGGYVLLAYDAFRQLFPSIVQDGLSRFRLTKAFAAMAKQFALVLPSDFDPDTASEDEIQMHLAAPDYRYSLNLTNQHFTSVEDMTGPYEYNGDNFTSILRFDLEDPLNTVNETYGIGLEITGYGSRQNFTQPFKAEDIILLYDGFCASTCTIFSEFMRLQGSVKSIAIGGRPSTGPMQTIGGVKGSNNFGFDYIHFLAHLAYTSGTPKQQQSANWTSLRELNLLASNRSTDTSINVRDNILPEHLDDGLPSQFVYERADCRLFYEPEMVVDVAAMWEAAADAAWGNKSCINGHLELEKRTASKIAKTIKTKMRVKKPKFLPPERAPWWVQFNGRKVPL
ncbi:hypothetical protein EYZ11_002925 [Aspergillus tanneri]|uniref:CPAF-like PDZ domain-containing protein n=1 Tax=Aspergillus tanneri TaxID=1220188 RepID=A0A4S3JQ57_9EURO|nr:hypothetical protein EYZ11_002925 [Aspergillus tanneri]